MSNLPTISRDDFEPRSFKELMQYADLMSRSDLVPKDYKGKAANIVTAVTAGRDLGLSAHQSMQSIAVIGGRATLWGDAMLGIVLTSGKCVKLPDEFYEGTPGTDDYTSVCRVQRVGEEEAKETRFSVRDAKKAGLWNKSGPWTDYPDRMLKMRARSWRLRDSFPDVLKGLVAAEEAIDYTEQNVTPKTPPGKPVSGNDAVRERLAATLGAAALGSPPPVAAAPPEPPPVDPVEGEVEPPMPGFDMMLPEQITDTLHEEAQAAGLAPSDARDVMRAALEGKKLSRETAPLVVKAFRRWKPPESLDAAPAADEPAAARTEAEPPGEEPSDLPY